MRTPPLPVLLTPLLPAAGLASDLQHVLRPAGPQAAHIQGLWDLMLVICAAVSIAVLAALWYALWRAPRSLESTPPEVSGRQPAKRGPRMAVIAATGLSAALLMVLIVASIATDRALARLPLNDAVNIQVTAHQWWWEVRYEDAEPSREFSTANELHIPVGRTVMLKLQSDDVIHSFWVPNLHGKKDLIPGRTATLAFKADQAGAYRGQCAEFCGYQHAFMAFTVLAQPPAQYEAWLERQRANAPEPANAEQARGREVFMKGTCVMCHAIQGTQAGGKTAPDLTHVGSRATLAAGTLQNTPQNLAAWIRDPHAFKPGVNMPANPLPAEDLQSLVAYLVALK
jgi:cytochrome c oxidase subunit II